MSLLDDSPDMTMFTIKLVFFLIISAIYGVAFLLHLFTSFTLPGDFLCAGKVLGMLWILAILYLVFVYITAPEPNKKDVEKNE